MDAFEVTLLFDTYGGMLTDKQREYLDMRYNQDMSLGEIAQVQGVSRQAVHDNLIRTENLLRRMEEHIGCVKRDLLIRRAGQDLMSIVDALEGSAEPAVQDAKQRIRAVVRMLEE